MLVNLKKLVEAKKKNKLPKIVVVVHFGGIPCEMDKIFKLSKKYKFKIIEDASHALGSEFKNSKIEIANIVFVSIVFILLKL